MLLGTESGEYMKRNVVGYEVHWLVKQRFVYSLI